MPGAAPGKQVEFAAKQAPDFQGIKIPVRIILLSLIETLTQPSLVFGLALVNAPAGADHCGGELGLCRLSRCAAYLKPGLVLSCPS